MKSFKVIEHQLTPFALITGNVALFHMIYIIANGLEASLVVSIIFRFALLILAIVYKNKFLLASAVLVYWLSFVICCAF